MRQFVIMEFSFVHFAVNIFYNYILILKLVLSLALNTGKILKTEIPKCVKNYVIFPKKNWFKKIIIIKIKIKNLYILR